MLGHCCPKGTDGAGSRDRTEVAFSGGGGGCTWDHTERPAHTSRIAVGPDSHGGLAALRGRHSSTLTNGR